MVRLFRPDPVPILAKPHPTENLMPKSRKSASPLAVNSAKAASRNTDSGPAHPAPPGTVPADLPSQKAADTQTLAAGMPANTNKALEHGLENAKAAPRGLTV